MLCCACTQTTYTLIEADKLQANISPILATMLSDKVHLKILEVKVVVQVEIYLTVINRKTLTESRSSANLKITLPYANDTSMKH